jgi:renalase
VGVPRMNAIISHMAADHEVAWEHIVTGLVRRTEGWLARGKETDHGPFDAIILAIPAEQAAPLVSLHDFTMGRVALAARSQPCWTGMFAFAEPLSGMSAIVRNAGDLAWAARNSSKLGRTGPEAWVVQANAAWSQEHLEDSPDRVAKLLLEMLAMAAGGHLPKPVAEVAHRWRFALSAGTGDGALWNPALALGVCGDWLLGPRVECAWLSGQMLAAHCIKAARLAERLVDVPIFSCRPD